jgi:hypothetical protein
LEIVFDWRSRRLGDMDVNEFVFVTDRHSGTDVVDGRCATGGTGSHRWTTDYTVAAHSAARFLWSTRPRPRGDS